MREAFERVSSLALSTTLFLAGIRVLCPQGGFIASAWAAGSLVRSVAALLPQVAVQLKFLWDHQRLEEMFADAAAVEVGVWQLSHPLSLMLWRAQTQSKRPTLKMLVASGAISRLSQSALFLLDAGQVLSRCQTQVSLIAPETACFSLITTVDHEHIGVWYAQRAPWTLCDDFFAVGRFHRGVRP